MGASAGGIEALRAFFDRMPPHSGLAFVLVQHLDPNYPSTLSELLARRTEMPVSQVNAQTPVVADHVDVIAPNTTLTLERGVLEPRPPIERRGLRVPIDRLFASVAHPPVTPAIAEIFRFIEIDVGRPITDLRSRVESARGPAFRLPELRLRSRATAMSYIDDDLPLHTVTATLGALDASPSTHPPRVLVLYGSLRERSFSRLLAEEAARVLTAFGAEVIVFRPHALPVFDRTSNDHPEVQKLRQLSIWSEAHVWVSPEQHGSMTGVFKNQIDWIPLEDGAVRPTQGRTLALMQVCGGSQSFNAVNQLRILGRWMRMFTIPNQSSVPKAWQEFDDAGRMKPSSYRDRVVDVVEELFRFTLLLRDRVAFLSTRYSEQKQLREQSHLTKGLGV